MRRILEAYDDIQKVAVKMRVNLSDDSPNLQDVLTSLRGLPNVITVNQHGPLEPAGNNKEWVRVLIKFENTVAVDLITLKMQMERLPTVDLVSLKTVDGETWDASRGEKEYDIARGPQGQRYAKEYGLGKFSIVDESILRRFIKNVILED